MSQPLLLAAETREFSIRPFRWIICRLHSDRILIEMRKTMKKQYKIFQLLLLNYNKYERIIFFLI